MTADPSGFRIEVDLDAARRAAEEVRDRLTLLRRQFDLTRFEFTRRVRIAPNEIPHSHPVLTLNTRPQSDDALLCTYLHEQMHWYLWRLGSPTSDPVAPFYGELTRRYPAAPTALPEGADDAHSTYLHLVVNWLEIDVASSVIGRERAIAAALATPVYRWVYRQVIADRDALGALYRRHGIVPIRPAADFANEIIAEMDGRSADA
jgi:hypothetical protein